MRGDDVISGNDTGLIWAGSHGERSDVISSHDVTLIWAGSVFHR
jgi:hypothetical protein